MKKINTLKKLLNFKLVNYEKVFFSIAIIFSCFIVKAQTIDTINFSINDIELFIENGYTRIFMNSCETTTENIGYPELPCMEVKYILPYNSYISSVMIIDSTTVLLSNNTVVYPKQPEYPMNDTVRHEFVNPNSDIYKSCGTYPYNIVDVSQQYYEKGFHIAKVNIYPIRYTPSDNKIELYTNIRFQINYEENESAVLRPRT